MLTQIPVARAHLSLQLSPACSCPQPIMAAWGYAKCTWPGVHLPKKVLSSPHFTDGDPRHRQVNPSHGVTELRPPPSRKSYFAGSTLRPPESEYQQLPPNPAHLSRSPSVSPPPDLCPSLSPWVLPVHLLPHKKHSRIYWAQWSRLTLPVGVAHASQRPQPRSSAPRRPPSAPLESSLDKTQATCRLSTPKKDPCNLLPVPLLPPTGQDE